MKRKQICTRQSSNSEAIAARDKEGTGSDYFCDYSPRYQKPYSIYDKAKKHAKKMKKVVDKEKSL